MDRPRRVRGDGGDEVVHQEVVGAWWGPPGRAGRPGAARGVRVRERTGLPVVVRAHRHPPAAPVDLETKVSGQ
ncbi:hypothetical protein GCM10017687_01430 [Streptomyces echinatus]